MKWLLAILVVTSGIAQGSETVDDLVHRGLLMEALVAAAAEIDESVAPDGDLSPRTREAFLQYAEVSRIGGHVSTAWHLGDLLLRAEPTWTKKTPLRQLVRMYLLMSRIERLLNGQKADEYLSQAESLVAALRTDAPDLWADVAQQRGNFTRRSNPIQAIEHYEKALHAREAHSQRPRWSLAQNLVWLGWNLQQRGEIVRARSLFARAERMLESADLGDSFERAVVEEGLGTVEVFYGRWDQARDRFARREALFDRLANEHPVGFPRIRFRSHRPPALAYIQLRDQQWSTAWNTAAQSEGRVNADFQRMARWPRLDPAGFKEVAAARLKRTQMPNLETLVGGRDWGGLIRFIRLETRIAKLETSFLGQHPPRQVTVKDVQAKLEANEAYIGWLEFSFGTGDILASTAARADVGTLTSRWMYVIRKDALHWFEVAHGETVREAIVLSRDTHLLSALLNTAASWAARVGPDPKVDREALKIGHALLADGMESLKGVEHLIAQSSLLIPNVPLESLRLPDGSWLTDRFTTVYSLSPSSFVMLDDAPLPRANDASILLVGDAFPQMPGATTSLSALPYVKEEIATLATNFKSHSVLAEGAASEGSVRGLQSADRLASFDILHFAGHFATHRFVEKNAIVFSANEKTLFDDGRIEVHEILDEWRLQARLVVLSGCKTFDLRGFNSIVVPIVQALLTAGASRVMGSSLDVDDEATKHLMVRFYANLTGGTEGSAPGRRQAPREALREARTWLRDFKHPDGRQPYLHPSYWAGYGLIGAR